MEKSLNHDDEPYLKTVYEDVNGDDNDDDNGDDDDDHDDKEDYDIDSYSKDEDDDEDSDSDYAPDTRTIEKIVTPKPAKSVGIDTKGSSRLGKTSNTRRLVRRPKKKRSISLTMKVKCDECDMVLTGRSNLKNHIKRVHLNVRDYKCIICGKGFWSRVERESHMSAIHTRQCESCQEYVVESEPWGKDVDMTTKRDVICSCGSVVSIFSKRGRQRMYLYDHEPDEEGNVKTPKSKTTGTKYACSKCGKLFSKKGSCERHFRTHTNIKPCLCDVCGSSFSYETSLLRHKLKTHGIAKHVCKVCGGNYSNRKFLKIHMAKVHGNAAKDDQDAKCQTAETSQTVDTSQKNKVYVQTPGGQPLMRTVPTEVQDHVELPDHDYIVDSETVKSVQKKQLYVHPQSGQLIVSTIDPRIFLDEEDSNETTTEVQEQEITTGSGGQEAMDSSEDDW